MTQLLYRVRTLQPDPVHPRGAVRLVPAAAALEAFHAHRAEFENASDLLHAVDEIARAPLMVNLVVTRAAVVAGVAVRPGDEVEVNEAAARFMLKRQLARVTADELTRLLRA